MFWVTFVIFVVTTVAYVIWASGDVQIWNYPKEWKSTEAIDNIEGKSESSSGDDDDEVNINNKTS